MEYKQVAVSVIIKDDKVLAVKRAKTQSLPGKWHLPGGKLESKETFAHALHRELMEELELKSQINDQIAQVKCSFPHGEYDLHFFRVMLYEGNIKLDPEDNEEYRWFSLFDMDTVEWLPLDKQVAILGLLEGMKHGV
jgi:8-oxo-dGTP diphosphatase